MIILLTAADLVPDSYIGKLKRVTKRQSVTIFPGPAEGARSLARVLNDSQLWAAIGETQKVFPQGILAPFEHLVQLLAEEADHEEFMLLILSRTELATVFETAALYFKLNVSQVKGNPCVYLLDLENKTAGSIG